MIVQIHGELLSGMLLPSFDEILKNKPSTTQQQISLLNALASRNNIPSSSKLHRSSKVPSRASFGLRGFLLGAVRQIGVAIADL
jgi:hypothetical protein